MDLLLTVVGLLVLQCTTLTRSSCISESCNDQHVESLRKYPKSLDTTAFHFRVDPDAIAIPNHSNLSDCKKTLELHGQDDSKFFIGFHIQVCSDNGKGHFDATFQNMDVKYTTCQAPLDTAILMPALLKGSKQYQSFQLIWIAPCHQSEITVMYIILNNYYENHGSVNENLHTELSKTRFDNRNKRGTCADARFTECCVSGPCTGSTPVRNRCYCDARCHTLEDCCSDINTTCPLGFTQRPQRFIATELEDAEFQCNVTVMATFEWSFIPMDSSIPVLIANETGTPDPKYSAVIGSTYSTVTVHNVQPMDQGLYTCSASSAFGNISATASLTVLVRVRPTKPTKPQVTGSFAVMEQDTLQLQCTCSGYPLPMITWVKINGEERSLLHSPRVSITTVIISKTTTASVLKIHNTINEDRGSYQCEASNAAGTNTSTHNIEIIGKDNCEAQPCQNGGACVDLVGNYLCNCNAAFTGRNCTESIVNDTPQVPTVVNPPMDTTAEIVHPVNLTCEAEGYPAPSYEWYLDGVLIPGEMLSYLYIPEAQPSDRGNYTCKASNDNGEIESHPALVNLTGVYQYVVTVHLSNQSSSEGLLEEAIQISASSLNTTVALFYSVEILSTNSSENVSLLFTMVGPFARQVLEMQTFSTAECILDGCDAEEEDGYSWPETNVAIAVVIPCPCEELLGALAGKAVRYCSGTFTNGATWNEIGSRDCAVATSTTTSTLCGLEGTPEEVAQEVMDITETAELVASDIAATVSILEVFNLTDQATFNPEVQNSYLHILDNIQQANASAVLESQMETRSSSRLLNSIGTFLDNVETSNDTNTTLFAFQTYALQAQDIDPRSFQGQTFNVDLGSVEEAMSISATINDSQITTSALVMDAVTNGTAAVQVPQSLLSNVSSRDSTSSNQRLSHTVFLTDILFQTEDPNTTIGSIIVGVQLNSTLNFNTSIPLRIIFQTVAELADSGSEGSCVSWDSDNFGAWSTSSCTDTTGSGNGHRVCSCKQLAHFGILFDLSPRPPDPAIALTLNIITYLLLVASLVCLTVFILTYTVSKKLRTSIQGQILINLSAALMGLYIMFAIGGSAVPIPAVCGVSSALLHYFILVFFGWTTVEAVWLYLKIVKVLGVQKYEDNFMLKASLPTWLVPLLIVIVSGGAGHKYYSNPFYCRPTQWPFYFALILPFIMVYAFNWVVYVVIMVSFCRHVRRKSNSKGGKLAKSQKEKLYHNFVVAITLAVVLGLGWGLGLLATSHNVQALTTAFQVLFSIFVGLQGVLIFVLHGVRNPDAREVWSNVIYYVKRSKMITRLNATSQADHDQPAAISSDIGLTTLTRTTLLPRKSEPVIGSSVSQMETCIEKNMELASNQDINANTDTALQCEVISNRNADLAAPTVDPPVSSVVSSDLDLATPPHKSESEHELDSFVCQLGNCAEDNAETASNEDTTKTDTVSQCEVITNRNAELATHTIDRPLPSKTFRGRRRSLPQLDRKQTSHRVYSSTDLEVPHWRSDGLQKAKSSTDI